VEIEDAIEENLVGVRLAEPCRYLSEDIAIRPVGVVESWRVDQMDRDTGAVREFVDLDVSGA
jgi:hypothetical protein